MKQQNIPIGTPVDLFKRGETHDMVAMSTLLAGFTPYLSAGLNANAVFRQVLPALARSQIQVLLRELRKEQAIHSVGLTKGARWFPGPVPANCNSDEPSS